MDFLSISCCRKGFDRKKSGKTEPTWRIFSLKELHAATNNFNYDNKLGEGGFGSVYRGLLWDGSQIAVKRFKEWNNKEDTDFAVEIEILARVRHKNLLSIRGYCTEGQERLVVYDYMANLSLVSHLHGQHSAESLLDWNRRLHIAIDSAQAIAYLHHHAAPHITHGNIRAGNILLDSCFQARVSDFGFGKLIPGDATKPKGNLGYRAPEHANASVKESEKCDVYSFGVLLLELVSGKKPIEELSATTKRNITEWVLPLACGKRFNEVADPRLNGNFVDGEVKKLVVIGLMCAHCRPERRPTMVEVVEMLKDESKEKLSELENDSFFKDSDNEAVCENDPDVIAEEKDPKH